MLLLPSPLVDCSRCRCRLFNSANSIKNQTVNEAEAKQLKETVSILTRFKGMPQFEWMEEMHVGFESIFNFKSNTNAIVGFDQKQYLKGLNHFSALFHAIQYKKVLYIQYRGFKQTKLPPLLLETVE